eukprot:CAMPEP_0196665218 /NCGR_PEP_ID=MMETSP1086-20130531/60037_1 /TAXON_ID=77921 /ORGANISM="Cyanoptyche  gloeocystis , Strain SAG4.97" /LENGTH=31 /DNA_ID= /DNA_START= /DNA_END= /DNA_ORIENTATION=
MASRQRRKLNTLACNPAQQWSRRHTMPEFNG